MNNTEILNFIKDLAREVGKFQVESINSGFKTESKETSYNLVTDIDKESEKRIVSAILKQFPNHNIIGEEDQYPQTDSEYYWIIDPIDGTNNYFKGVPYFAVSIALAKKENDKLNTQIGVVYNPYIKDLYHAILNEGSYKNDKKIQVSKQKAIKGGLFITGFYYDRGDSMEKNLDAIKRIFKKDVLGVRRFGSGALDMCLLAQGSAEGYWEHYLSIWDFAAAILILREAGGMMTDYNGKNKDLEHGSAICSNGLLHEELLKEVNGTR